MSFAVYNMFHFEFQATGLTFQTTNSYFENYTFSEGLLLLTFDIALYSFLGYYFDNVLKSEIGVSKPWYFLCTKKYWCGNKNVKKQKNKDYTF